MIVVNQNMPWWPGHDVLDPTLRECVLALPTWEGAGSVAHNLIDPSFATDAVLTSDLSRSGWVGKEGHAAILLDGTDDWLEIPDHPAIGLDGVAHATFCAWIYPNSFGENNQGRIFDKGGGSSISTGYTLMVNDGLATALLELNVNSVVGDWQAQSSANAVVTGEWQHVAAVYDGVVGNVDFYRNGVPHGSDAIASGTAIAANAEVLRLGARIDGNREFDGYLDDMLIFTRHHTAAEIKALYELGPGGWSRRARRIARLTVVAAAGRIMSSLVGAGGLAGAGGIAGSGGGLAG